MIRLLKEMKTEDRRMALLCIIVGYFAAKIAADFSFDIREKVFDKVAAFGSGEVKKFSAASLITRTTNDITQIQMVIATGNGFPVPGHDLCAERTDAGHILDRRDRLREIHAGGTGRAAV